MTHPSKSSGTKISVDGTYHYPPELLAHHMVRVFNRGHVRGIFISASDYTPAAILSCKESLQGSVFILCALEEFVLLLEQEKDLRELLKQKVMAAMVDKNPYYKPLKLT